MSQADPVLEAKTEVDPPQELAVDQRWEAENLRFQLTQRWPDRGGWRVASTMSGHLDYHDAYFATDADIRRCRYVGMAPAGEHSPPPPTRRSPPLFPLLEPSKKSNVADVLLWMSCGAMIALILVMVLPPVISIPIPFYTPPPPKLAPLDKEMHFDGHRYRCTSIEAK